MNQNLTQLEQTFLDLAAIGEVHPKEHDVLAEVKQRLKSAGVPFEQDGVGNIVAYLEGPRAEPLALVAHTDIAAPLNGRQVVIEPGIIKTDGRGLLGADDKAAVAAMLELAAQTKAGTVKPARPIELIFTVGEEAGCVGALVLDMTLVRSSQALVLDWTGRVNRLVSKSPAYVKIDVEYTGLDAHPAEWETGKNAGAALAAALANLQQGEYTPGVTCNVGIFNFGKARNQVPGWAALQAELRSHNQAALQQAIDSIRELFESTAKKHEVTAAITIAEDSAAYELNQGGALFASVSRALAGHDLKPELEDTFGGFDGNILAARGLEVIMLGAGYYNPHSPSEYVSRSELAELLAVLQTVISR